MTDRVIDVPGGHRVALAEYGDPAGAPVVYLHGAGSCRLEAQAFDKAARDQGIRVVALDRPARSVPVPPAASPTAYAEEVAAVADHLGIGRFLVSGQSNGGMFASAVGSVLGERVTAVVPINPTVPAADRAVRAALNKDGRIAYWCLLHFPGAFARLTSGLGLKEPSAKRAAKEPDGALWSDPVVGPILRETAQVRTSVEYMRRELELGIVRHWDFDHLALRQPVDFFMGDRDGGLPYVRIWSERLADSRVHVVPGGHIAHVGPQASTQLVELWAGLPNA